MPFVRIFSFLIGKNLCVPYLTKQNIANIINFLVFSITARAVQAREQTFTCNKMRALEGPPGSGKTTVAKAIVQEALNRNLPVLWCVFTGALSARMRSALPPNVSTNTCHGGLALHEELHERTSCMNMYGLIMVDEFSQLQDWHFQKMFEAYKSISAVPTFGLLGDKSQMGGFGTRVWATPRWRKNVHTTELHELHYEPRNRPTKNKKPKEHGHRRGHHARTACMERTRSHSRSHSQDFEKTSQHDHDGHHATRCYHAQQLGSTSAVR